MSKKINEKKAIENLSKYGYHYAHPCSFIDSDQVDLAKKLSDNKAYKIGRYHKTSNPSTIPTCLFNLVVNSQIKNIFTNLYSNTKCNEIFITHEYKANEMERNLWLHFDRLRSLKAMVYLVDVGEHDGPFSVVPGSHKKGRELRNKFKNIGYERLPNRIELDYPNLYEKPTKICGKAGTLILFDTDIFHKGGDIKEGCERLLIRSHWYPNFGWRASS